MAVKEVNMSDFIVKIEACSACSAFGVTPFLASHIFHFSMRSFKNNFLQIYFYPKSFWSKIKVNQFYLICNFNLPNS